MKPINLLISALTVLSSVQANCAVFLYTKNQHAIETPFDNTSNGFTATDVQAAIEEALTTARTKDRYFVMSGFDGTASTGRWLEFLTNVASNISGFVVPKDSYMEEYSIACQSSTTVTVGIFVNAVQVDTFTVTTERKGTKDVFFQVNALDEISFKINSGSCSKTTMAAGLRYK